MAPAALSGRALLYLVTKAACMITEPKSYQVILLMPTGSFLVQMDSCDSAGVLLAAREFANKMIAPAYQVLDDAGVALQTKVAAYIS